MIGLKNLTSTCSKAETYRCRIVRVTWLRLNAETDGEVVEIPATAISSHWLLQPETADTLQVLIDVIRTIEGRLSALEGNGTYALPGDGTVKSEMKIGHVVLA